MDAKQAVETLAIVGIGVFAIIIILSLTYQGYASTSSIQLQNSGYTITQQATTNSIQTTNQVATGGSVNTLTLNSVTGAGWIGTGNPLTVTVTGLTVATYQTSNAAGAVNSVGFTTQTFQVTSLTNTNAVLIATGANFWSINTVTFTGFTGQSTAFPAVTGTVSETYNTLGGLTNTISANEIANVITGASFGTYSNFTKYAGPLPNTYASNLGLAITALVLFVVIAIIAGLFLNQRGTGVLGE